MIIYTTLSAICQTGTFPVHFQRNSSSLGLTVTESAHSTRTLQIFPFKIIETVKKIHRKFDI